VLRVTTLTRGGDKSPPTNVNAFFQVKPIFCDGLDGFYGSFPVIAGTRGRVGIDRSERIGIVFGISFYSMTGEIFRG
jgi:hypothetical protein